MASVQTEGFNAAPLLEETKRHMDVCLSLTSAGFCHSCCREVIVGCYKKLQLKNLKFTVSLVQ